MRKILFVSCVLFYASMGMAKDIVVTIKPLHSLVQSVLGDTQKAVLLLNSNASPHSFSLKPSHIRAISKAKAIFYIDKSFESFLVKSLNNLPSTVTKTSISSISKLLFLERRDGYNWSSDSDDHHHHHGEEDDDVDLHVWLNTNNAKIIVQNISDVLSKIYPSNKDIYKANAKKTIHKIDKLDKFILSSIKKSKVSKKAYIVSHDGYQYFERQYNLNGVGAISTAPHLKPSAKHIREIRAKLKAKKVVCIFQEPQSSDKLIQLIKNKTNVKIAKLDNIGVDIQEGEDLYIKLMQDLSTNMVECLK